MRSKLFAPPEFAPPEFVPPEFVPGPELLDQAACRSAECPKPPGPLPFASPTLGRHTAMVLAAQAPDCVGDA